MLLGEVADATPRKVTVLPGKLAVRLNLVEEDVAQQGCVLRVKPNLPPFLLDRRLDGLDW